MHCRRIRSAGAVFTNAVGAGRAANNSCSLHACPIILFEDTYHTRTSLAVTERLFPSSLRLSMG